MTTAPATPSLAATTMRAIVQRRYGSADVLHLEGAVPRPEPGEGEVQLRVRAAGVDRGTWHMMSGLPYLGRLAFGVVRPKHHVPGLDVAGIVTAVGAGVSRFVPGDEVYGFGQGTFAEYTVAQESKLARRPANLSFEQAAVIPVSAVTAFQGLREVGRLEAGQSVLIIGASGGVGSYAVQLAKAFGAEVTGVCSTTKIDLVRSLGADHLVDYTREDFANGDQRYDLILDLAGNPGLARLRRALTPRGTAVIVGGEGGGSFSGGMNRQLRAVAMSPLVKQRLTMFIAKQRASDLEELTPLFESGQVSPSVERTYGLAQAPEAIRHLEAGRVRGKVAITLGAA
jgi:NADPH:quinone reductase-like Zn-dependent oxidoreductase